MLVIEDKNDGHLRPLHRKMALDPLAEISQCNRHVRLTSLHLLSEQQLDPNVLTSTSGH
jgi:hypothetical protein